MIFEDPEGYLIEFVDREGETIDIEDVKLLCYIKVVTPSDSLI